MTTVFLHIGMPKCASTSVQSYFHHNDKEHRALGVCYPRSYRSEGGYFSHRPLLHASIADYDAVVTEIALEAEAAECDKIILSSEEMMNSHWDKDRTAQLIAALNRKFGVENVRLVALLRNHVEFVESSFAQFLRGGLFRVKKKDFFNSKDTTIRGYINWFKDTNGFDFFSFQDFLTAFQSNAPKNPLLAFSIEKADTRGRDITHVFSKCLKLPPPQDLAPKNTRPSRKALLMLRYAIGRYGGALEPRRLNMVQKMCEHSPDGYSPVLDLPSGMMKRVVACAQKDDAYLRSAFDGSFAGLLEGSMVAQSASRSQEKLVLQPNERALADYIICAETLSRSKVERVKGELGL